MGMFSSKKADDLRTSGKEAAAVARVAKAAGADKLAKNATRNAATKNVVARYADTGRCQFGHKNCQVGGH